VCHDSQNKTDPSIPAIGQFDLETGPRRLWEGLQEPKVRFLAQPRWRGMAHPEAPRDFHDLSLSSRPWHALSA